VFEHELFMRRASLLARTVPDRPFAALLIDEDGRVVAEGISRVGENPTWHSEIDAINRAAATGPVEWRRLTLYSTAEPCPMCMAALLWCGVPAVVFGTSIATLMRLGWKQIDIHAHEMTRRARFGSCTLVGGVCEADCDALFRAAVGR
jgi:tRNA(adenine34) deaminase